MNNFFRNFKGYRLKKGLLKDICATFFMSAINAVLMIGLLLILVRSMGPENYGIYVFITSIITLLGLPTKVGLPTLIVREIAKYKLNKKWSYLHGLLTVVNIFVIIFSVLIAAITACLAWWFWSEKENVKTITLLWALFLLPLIAFANIRGATLRGLGKVIQGQLPEQLVYPLSMLILLVATLWLGNEISSVLAVQYRVFAAFLAFVVGAFVLARAIPKKIFQTKRTYDLKIWGATLLSLSLFQGLKAANIEFIFIIIGFLTSAENVGLYKVAHSGSLLIMFVQLSINATLAPQIVKLYNANKNKKLQRIITLTTRGVVALSLPVALFFIFFSEQLIELLFGSEYQAAAIVLTILALGQLLNTLIGPAVLILNMTGHEKLNVKGIILALLLNIVLSFILIPLYGLVGAAIATVVSLTSWKIVLAWWTYKYTGLKLFIR